MTFLYGVKLVTWADSGDIFTFEIPTYYRESVLLLQFIYYCTTSIKQDAFFFIDGCKNIHFLMGSLLPINQQGKRNVKFI